ncbi:MAG: hypothetical protein K2M91_07950 [Lachnospiraceae bacterium]|nr:hypothetical protein [Lachnospiraceae bacterium]
MLSSKIRNAQENSEEDMLLLIEKFRPLMVKYARKLDYEDAYNDIMLYFIKLIKSINLDKLTDQTDKIIISYINKSITNFYNKKIPQMVLRQKEVVMSELTEEQQYYIEVKTAQVDEINILDEYGLKYLLTETEGQLIYQVYVEGHSIAELARHQNRTRQAVNQQRIRAIRKIKACLQ